MFPGPFPESPSGRVYRESRYSAVSILIHILALMLVSDAAARVEQMRTISQTLGIKDPPAMHPPAAQSVNSKLVYRVDTYTAAHVFKSDYGKKKSGGHLPVLSHSRRPSFPCPLAIVCLFLLWPHARYVCLQGSIQYLRKKACARRGRGPAYCITERKHLTCKPQITFFCCC